MITTDCASSDSKTRDGHRRPRHDCALLFFSTSFTDEQATQGHSPYVFFSCMALVGASLLPDSSSKASMIRAIPSTRPFQPVRGALERVLPSPCAAGAASIDPPPHGRRRPSRASPMAPMAPPTFTASMCTPVYSRTISGRLTTIVERYLDCGDKKCSRSRSNH